MKNALKHFQSSVNRRLIQIMAWCFLLPASQSVFSKPLIITGIQVITTPTVYSNATLDLSHGAFLITKNATLTIVNSSIKGTLSPENPRLFTVSDGGLTLSDSHIDVTSENISPSPRTPPQYSVISVLRGQLSLSDNEFSTNRLFTAGLLVTGSSPTSGMNIIRNVITNFHGGILLMNSSNDIISDNTFSNVSSGNIYIRYGHNIALSKNTILFSGNNDVGDSFDIIDSDSINITDNHIFSGTCYSIFIMRSRNIFIGQNSVSGGITYAVFISDSPNLDNLQKTYLLGMERLFPGAPASQGNRNITITQNYLSQNRFGLAATSVHSLTVTDNQFIQRFDDAQSRKFWTNNDVLLKNILNLKWKDNLYKEAFTQDATGSNHDSFTFIPYPEHNGIQFEQHKV